MRTEELRRSLEKLPETFNADEARKAWGGGHAGTIGRLRRMLQRGWIVRDGRGWYRQVDPPDDAARLRERLEQARLPGRIDQIAERWQLALRNTHELLREMVQAGMIECTDGRYHLPGEDRELPPTPLENDEGKWLQQLPEGEFSYDQARACWGCRYPQAQQRINRLVAKGWCQRSRPGSFRKEQAGREAG